MLATLRFSLPEEATEHRLALDGGKWADVVWDLDQWLRAEIKYGTGNPPDISTIRAKLNELIQEAGLEFPE